MKTLKKSITRITLIASAACLALTPAAFADPFGIEYGMLLDFPVSDGTSVSAEGHSAKFFGTPALTFDGLVDGLLLDLPAGPFPPFLPGFDLAVTESAAPGPGPGEEVLSFDVFNPTSPGAPLFANSLDPSADVFFSVFDLHWGSTPGTVTGVETSVFFDTPFGPAPFAIAPSFGPTISGTGTLIDPLALDFFFLSTDFTTLGPAVGFALDITIAHESATAGGPLTPVPEPTTVILLGTGLLGLVGYNRRRNAA